jgi:hypothetical protein
VIRVLVAQAEEDSFKIRLHDVTIQLLTACIRYIKMVSSCMSTELVNKMDTLSSFTFLRREFAAVLDEVPEA